MAMLGIFLLMIASTSTAPTPGTVYLVIKLPDNLLPAKKTQGKMLDIETLKHLVWHSSFGYQGLSSVILQWSLKDKIDLNSAWQSQILAYKFFLWSLGNQRKYLQQN